MAYHVALLDSDFQPFDYLCRHQKITQVVGAQSVFVGYMRDFREDTHVSRMTISHYPPMTQQHLEQLAEQCVSAFQLIDLLVVHRVGDVVPTNPLVLVAATASHRANAIEAGKQLLEDLKHNVPFWKKEYQNNDKQGTWVEGNSDYLITPYSDNVG